VLYKKADDDGDKTKVMPRANRQGKDANHEGRKHDASGWNKVGQMMVTLRTTQGST
jgi:hypothetical protein